MEGGWGQPGWQQPAGTRPPSSRNAPGAQKKGGTELRWTSGLIFWGMHACPCTGGSRGGPGDGSWVTKPPGGCPKLLSPPLPHPGFAIVLPRWLLAMGTPESRLAPQPSLGFGLHPSLLPLVQYFSSPQAGASRLLSLHDFSCSRSPPGSPGWGTKHQSPPTAPRDPGLGAAPIPAAAPPPGWALGK